MTPDEDKSHFSMWCMLNSPLLAGNDLRNMTKETIDILTNKEVIALNQDTAFVQGHRLYRSGDIEVWMKPLGDTSGRQRAIAILNRGEATNFTLNAARTGLKEKSTLRDLWLHNDLGRMSKEKTFSVLRHGIVLLRVGY